FNFQKINTHRISVFILFTYLQVIIDVLRIDEPDSLSNLIGIYPNRIIQSSTFELHHMSFPKRFIVLLRVKELLFKLSYFLMPFRNLNIAESSYHAIVSEVLFILLVILLNFCFGYHRIDSSRD